MSTLIQPLERSSIVIGAKIEALKSMAKALLNIDLIEAKIGKEKELGKELTPDETIQLFEDEMKKLRDGKHNPQRIIREEELERHLVDGWLCEHTAVTEDTGKEGVNSPIVTIGNM